MYENYLILLEEAGKNRNLKERSVNCYKNYVSYFLNYMNKMSEDLTCQDVRKFLLAKKDEGLKATTLNLYNSAIRFFYRNVLHIHTHRIAISNHRILRMDENTVTFPVKDYRNNGKWKELTLSGIEFIRRFLMHIPPRRFVRIRHYGLLCSRTENPQFTLCRNLLGCQKYLSKLRDMEMPEILEHLYGIRVCVCKACDRHLGKPQLRSPLRC